MNLSLGYNFGILAAVLVGALVGLGIIALLFRLKIMDLTFDERQERARGQAYKYGFWTLMTCLLLYGFSDMVLGRWCDVITGVMLCVAVAMVVFAVLAMQYSEKRNSALMVTFGALALLFQPFFKIALGRDMWNVVDVVVAIFLVALCIKERNNA